ncbi:MAG: 50S ribosomal protein L15 [Abditibacteriales bacterium]|nr:50S ribosomal protein L15 [Abditibacteriales bacterium]MDW8364998.1 50S ribosomal protein L15 [Abditibacteriales bacterium]
MRIDNLRPAVGARRKKKRVGRGIGSGHGKTSTRGQKGQRARDGIAPGFEGGQTPLHRRLPKQRGLARKAMPVRMFKKTYAIVNVEQLEKLEAHTMVTPELLKERGVIKQVRDGVRVLGKGELTKPLTVRAHHFSASALQKIEAAGGTAEVI